VTTHIPKHLPAWLRPPTLSEPHLTERARVLYVMLLATLVALVAATLLVDINPADMYAGVPLIGAFAALQIAGLWGVHRGWVKLVGGVYCGVTWVLLIASQLLVGFNDVGLTSSFINITFLAGFAIGSRAALLFGTATALWLGTSVYMKSHGLLPPPLVEQGPMDLAVQAGAPLAVTAVLTAYGLLRLRTSVSLALEAEQANQARAREGQFLGDLGQRVVELRDSDEAAREVADVVSKGLTTRGVAIYRSGFGGLRLVSSSQTWGAPPQLKLSLRDLSPTAAKVFEFDAVDELADFEAAQGVRRVAVVRVAGHNTEGGAVLVASSDETPFDDHQLYFLQACANLLAAAAERTHAEGQLRQTHKMEVIGQLAGGVAHDFNNLLTSILSCAELGLHEVGEDHPATSLLEDIRRSGEHAAILTRQLLAFSRKATLRLEVVDIVTLVDTIQRVMKRMLGERIALEVDVEDKPCCVYADSNALEQVLFNLALNARDAMQGSGHIRIEVKHRSLKADKKRESAPMRDWVVLSVTDDGCGMDAETRARIFEPFFTTKDMGEGTGLGLATVQGIIDELGGRIEVQSAPSQGARFEVMLPMVPAAASSATRGDEKGPRAQGTETCLLVEDHVLARRALAGTISSAGYRVVEANNGNEALAMLEARGDIDVVLSDVVMPEMTGPEMVRRLRQRPGAPPVVLLSGYVGPSESSQMLTEMGVSVLSKPVPSGKLLSALRTALDDRAKRSSTSTAARAATPARDPGRGAYVKRRPISRSGNV
jgi:signal transduction histidine kinase/ActR/RegA family two-component response regulator